MKHYVHLTQNQRYQIYSLLKTTTSQSEIARIIDCDNSTVSCEIRRKKGKRGYCLLQANKHARSRKANNSLRVTAFGWIYVKN